MAGVDVAQRRVVDRVGVGVGDAPQAVARDDVDREPVGELGHDRLDQGDEHGLVVVDGGREQVAGPGEQHEVAAGVLGAEAGPALHVAHVVEGALGPVPGARLDGVAAEQQQRPHDREHVACVGVAGRQARHEEPHRGHQHVGGHEHA